VLALGGAAAAGFVAGRETAEDTPRTVTEVRARDVSICVNAAYGFAVAYPRGWHTDRLGPETACFFFDPEPFEIPEASDFGGTALEVLVAQEDAEALVRSMVDPRFARSPKRQDAVAGGRRAVRVEYVATGAGLLDEGTRVYAYVVDRDDLSPIILQTTARPPERLRRDVVDLAARTLHLLRPAVSELPSEVAETRAAIVAAARGRDFAALRRLIPKTAVRVLVRRADAGPGRILARAPPRRKCAALSAKRQPGRRSQRTSATRVPSRS
jgi:hypothetical protein